ncbi:MAG TPA: hypothetical protein VMF58_07415 [Rhizomicrobium sp.]|nr:hypothetical protein [Rhizomicrobium sp.]
MDAINSLGTVIIACAVGVIAYRQYWVARQAHRLALFDRRYELFKVQQKFLSALANAGAVDATQFPAFLDAMQKSQFLLDDEFCSYLNEIYKRSVHVNMLEKQINSDAHAEARDQKVDEEDREAKWLLDQLPLLIKKYKRFLKVRA